MSKIRRFTRPRSQGANTVTRSQTLTLDGGGNVVDKLEVTRAAAKYLVNPVVSLVAGYVPWWALLETRGRRSGIPRRNPVGNGLKGHTFWIVAEHGRHAGYVKNIEADPRVRIRVGGRWRNGVAHLMQDDDPRLRQQQLRKINAAFVRLMATQLLTIRVDLEHG